MMHMMCMVILWREAEEEGEGGEEEKEEKKEGEDKEEKNDGEEEAKQAAAHNHATVECPEHVFGPEGVTSAAAACPAGVG